MEDEYEDNGNETNKRAKQVLIEGRGECGTSTKYEKLDHSRPQSSANSDHDSGWESAKSKPKTKPKKESKVCYSIL